MVYGESLLTSGVTLTSDTQPGLKLKVVREDFAKKHKSKNAQTADELILFVTIRSAKDLSPRLYQIPVALHYQAVNSHGELEPQSTSLVIPVEVVASKSEVHANEHPDRWKGLKTAGMVLLIIPMIPIGI